MPKLPSLDTPQKFILKLYKLVNDPDHKYIIWNRNGVTIKITDRFKFSEQTLPLISKTRDYSGFVRQLNNYGFSKCKDTDEEEYFNEFFLQNRYDFLVRIQRNREKSSFNSQIEQWMDECNLLKNNVEFLNESNYRLSKEIIMLKERITRQEKTIAGMIDVLSNVFKAGIEVEDKKCLKNDSDQNNENFNNLYLPANKNDENFLKPLLPRKKYDKNNNDTDTNLNDYNNI